jgi:PAS domain S-box/PAS domain S-box
MKKTFRSWPPLLLAVIGTALALLGMVEVLAWMSSSPYLQAVFDRWMVKLDRGTLILASGLYFWAMFAKKRGWAAASALAVIAISCARLAQHILPGHVDQKLVISAMTAFGYALAGLGMLALLRRERLTYSTAAIVLVALPFLGAVFFLLVYIVDTSLLIPSIALQYISLHAAFALALTSLSVLLVALGAWRKDGHHSARFMLFAAFSGFASMAVASWLAVVWANYSATIRESERQVMAAANFIDGYAERALEGAELLVLKTLKAVQDESLHGTLSISSENRDEIMAAKSSLPQVHDIAIADAAGTVVFTSSPTPLNDLSPADHAYFKIHRDSDVASYLGGNIALEHSGHSVFTLSRRIDMPDGSFGGVVVVAMDTGHFNPIFERLGFGDDAVAALVKLNNEVLAASGTRQTIQANWTDASALSHFRQNPPSGEIVVQGELDDGLSRIVALHPNERMGIVTIASANEATVLAKWKRSVGSTAAVLVIVLTGGGLLALLCHHSIRREEILQQRTSALVAFQEAVLDSASAAILAINTQGVITLFNRASEDLFGYRAADMVGKRTPDCLFDPAEIAARARELSAERGVEVPADASVVAANALTDPYEEREWTCVRSDGSKIPVVISVSAFRDANGEIAGFLGVMNGISARRQAEREMRYSEARLRAILDNVIDGIITINAQGIIQSVNPAAVRIFGYTVDEVVDQNVKMLMGEPYHSQHDGYLSNYLSTGHAQIIGRGREVEGRRKDGTFFPLDLAVSQVDLAGRAMFIGVIRDLSDAKRVERLKAEFVSTVSHELRTPLTAIRGSLALVNSGILGEVPDDVKELTVVAEQSSERLVRLINDILDVEKIGSGQMKLDMQAVDLGQAVERAVTDTRAFAEQYGVRLVIAETLPNSRVLADFDRLVQIFTNLISNAAKFSPRDSEVVLATTQPKPGRVRITVKDSGIGISEEFKGRIFGKFAQADGSDSKTKGGTGLGLNITKNLVERMAGTISFESEPGQGTTFIVEFPLLGGAKAAADSAIGGKRHILHVEDDEAIRTMIARLLAGQADVSGARNVEEGVAMAHSRAYDLAIVDLGLGDGSGLDVVPHLCNAAGLPPPVIVFSAHDQIPAHLPPSVALCLTKSRATDRELADAVRSLIPKRTAGLKADEEQMS